MEDGLLEMIKRLGLKQEAATGVNPDAAFASFDPSNYNHGNQSTIEDLLEEIIIRLDYLGAGAGEQTNILNTLSELLGTQNGGDFVAPDGAVMNSNNEQVLTVPSGSSLFPQDQIIQQVDGTEDNYAFGSSVVSCAFKNIRVVNEAKDLLGTIDSWPLDGEFEVTLPSEGVGIAYHRVVPTQTNSFTPGDAGYLNAYSIPVKSNPIYPNRYARLQTHWYLLEANEFNHQYRFTTIDGQVAGDQKANFSSGQFPPGYLGYVIDHYTGVGIYQFNWGNLNWFQACQQALTLNDSNFLGFNDWYIPHLRLWTTIVDDTSQYINGGNVWRRSGGYFSSGFNESRAWLAEYDETTPVGGGKYVSLNNDIGRLAADQNLFASCYIVRDHYK